MPRITQSILNASSHWILLPIGLPKNKLTIQRYFSACRQYIFHNQLLFLFIIIGLAIRIVFWIYTGRTWEDALITLTPARNAWEGFGLTHHASEPRVHSYTSPISVLIPLLGEAVGQGLFALKFASLVGSGATIYYAYRIGQFLCFHWSAQALVLGYLATDQLQVFFGMSGMETQIATAIALANGYYYLSSQWWKLGLAVGMGLICRPEFLLWVPILGVSLLIFERKALLPVIAASAFVAAPWYLFAIFYYGSPIPHTIIAKSLSYRYSFLSPWTTPLIWDYAAESWKSVAPFREFWYAIGTPISDTVLRIIVALIIALALIGVGRSVFDNKRMLGIATFVAAFVIYRTGSVLPTYFMWYLPPFVALLFVLAGYGLSTIAAHNPPTAAVLGLAMAFVYALHIPFSFPLDRKYQKEIDEAVRLKVGAELNKRMTMEDTAVLEPLGYIGWAARNKTIYDMPGLGSKISVEALSQRSDATISGLVDALKPTYIVVRPQELEALRKNYPETADLYSLVFEKQAKAGLEFVNMGYRYVIIDDHYKILKRRSEKSRRH